MKTAPTIPTDPSNPTTEYDCNGGTIQGFGLTKQEHFAAMAMQGILSNPQQCFMSDAEVSEKSVEMSDALIEALNKEKS